MNDSAVTVSLPAIAILGSGAMGSAILSGLVQRGVETAGIRVTNRTRAKAARLAELEGVTSLALEDDPDANLRAVDGARVVLVAVKPAMVPDLLREIGGAVEPGAVVVSVAAGVTSATFESILPASVPVVRAMPNTPATVRLGVTGIAAGGRASADDLSLVRSIFETVGEVVEIAEDQIDAISTISGSGPAYVFYLIEELTRTAIDKGFPPEQAAMLVQSTFRGASELLASSGASPEELRRQVTSPKGTTERAIAVLQAAGLKELFDRATDAALARSREIAAAQRGAV